MDSGNPRAKSGREALSLKGAAAADRAFTDADLADIKARTNVRDAVFFLELPSTSDYALQRAQSPALPLPFLVLAQRQTAGRGRGSNRWFSEAGALTFSLIVDLDAANLPASRWSQCSLMAGLAVRAALARMAPDCKFAVKWPNDVCLAGRKVSGILAETSPRAPGRMAIGIGVNVNNDFTTVPADLPSRAASLMSTTGRRFDPIEILIAALNEIGTRIDLLPDPGPALAEEWRKHCLLDGRWIEMSAGSRRVSGQCRGIDHDGALLVETQAGLERFLAGVVERVRMPE